MTFAHPHILLALLLLPIAALLYIRRAGKREATVPTLMLWKAAATESAAETGKRMGALDLPLALALLFLLTAITAASGPTLSTGSTAAPHVLIIADRSARMASKTESGATRWSESVNDAVRLLDQLDVGKVTLVGLPLAAGPGLEELTPADARARLRELSPTDMPLDLVAELSRCAGIARSVSVVIVLTDNAAIVPKTLAGRPVFTISHGGPSRNVAVDAFEVTLSKDDHLDLFFAVKNYSKTRVTGGLVFGYYPEPQPRDDDKKVDLAPGATATFTISGKRDYLFGSGWAYGLGAHRFRLRLDTEDDLDADNHAFFPAHLPLSRELRVAYVGRGNQFITRALGLLPGVNVSQFRLTKDVTADFDLYIYDGQTPDKLPAGDVILIDPAGTVGPFTVRGAATDATGLRVRKAKDSPLLKDIDVAALRFRRLINVRADGAAALLTSAEDGGTALMQWQDAKTRVIVIGSALTLAETNWPQLPSFPIFWSNVIDDVAGRPRTNAGQHYWMTGEHIPVRQRSGNTLSVTGPDGKPVGLITGQGARSYFLPMMAGIYTVTDGLATTRYAVNMMHPTESANAGTPSTLSAEDMEAILAPSERAGAPLWRHFAAAALLLALGYWAVAARSKR